MKNIFTLLLALITFVSYGQKNQSVDLRWKIDKETPLNYITVMSNIEDDNDEFSENTDNDVEVGDIQDFFKSLSQLSKVMNNQEYVTTLSSKENGVIDIIMNNPPQEVKDESEYLDLLEVFKEISEEVDTEEEDIDDEGFMELMKSMEALQSMYQGVVLRGSVYETGPIHSFWVKNDQKNLIALFYQLPENPVKIGDKWSLEVNFIGNDQTFVCDNAYKTNEVTLTDIKEVNGEKIAVLEYNLIEFVEGSVEAPFLGEVFPVFNDEKELSTFINQEGKVMMKYSYQATAEFSIDKGHWVSYEGVTEVERNGVFGTKQKVKYALIKQ